MLQSVQFNTQFFRAAVNGVAQVAASCQLETHPAGTPGTNEPTYTDSTGGTANANPIILDADGRCNLWLNPAKKYLLRLKTPVAEGGSLIREWDNVAPAADAAAVVTSVNSKTGAVTLVPADLAYVAPAFSWFVAANAQDALDQLATRLNAPPAAAVTIVDAGSIITATNVEDALQEIATKANANAGRLLRVTTYTATGTWTKGTDVGSIVVEVVGGGGGSTSLLVGGGGGGGGGYSAKRVLSASLGATETVTVGAGGAAGVAGSTSSFGAHASATGGDPGASSGGSTAGGAGGAGSGGTINLSGDGGGAGGDTSTNKMFGHGGSSRFGGGAPGAWNRTNGVAGVANSGGGGSGGTSAGAAGGSGRITVWEYS